MEYLLRGVFYNIYKNRKKLFGADLKTTQRSEYAKTNISNRKDIQKRFDHDLKEEIAKLEGQMKIGWSTLKCLGSHLRAQKYSNEEELKKLKFSKEYLKQFVKRAEISFTRRKSNQKKISNEQLNELRKPINDKLSGFSKDRVINMDETGHPYSDSHQKGTFTCEKNMENFKEKCCRMVV